MGCPPRMFWVKNSNLKIEICSEKVLRFGMIDGTAVVNAKYAVFDPQNADCPESFKSNGSTAEHLALVLNRYEANLLMSDSSIMPVEELAIKLAKQERSCHYKNGAARCSSLREGNITNVPAYRTKKIWKIGSGDTFAAHFALGWMDNGLSAHAAAEKTSIATAFYCEHQRLS